MSAPIVVDPNVPVFENRFVDDAIVAKSDVVVAFVILDVLAFAVAKLLVPVNVLFVNVFGTVDDELMKLFTDVVE